MLALSRVDMFGLADDAATSTTPAAAPATPATDDATANNALKTWSDAHPGWAWFYGALSVAGAGSGAYHGYKRHHDSIGWAIGWFFLGGIFPVLTIPLSLAEGFGKPQRT